MRDQRERILEAAVSVFMRFGVGRTRMSDIATEARIARQTIYLSFKNKDEILCASIRHYSDLSLAEIKSAWASLDSLEDKLDAFYDLAVVSSYSIVNASSEARDMIGGYNAAGKAEIARAQKGKIAVWKKCLAAHKFPADSGIKPDRLAEFIVLGSIGLRDQAGSKKHLKALLDVQKRTILAWLG